MKLKLALYVAVAAALTALTIGVLSPKSDASANTASTAVSATAESVAVRAISKATSAVRDSEIGGWGAPLYKDSMLDILANAQELATLAASAANKDEANLALTSSARLLDIAAGRLDGQTGDSETAHLNDWTTDSRLTTTLHGVVIQARSEVLRLRRE